MPERLPHIPDSELEQLLTDAGRWITYPATPDFARAFEVQPAATTNGLAPTEDREVWRPPTGRLGIHSASTASMDDRPRSRKNQALRLAGAAAAFAIVGLILVLLFRELDDGGQAGGVPTSPPTVPLLIAVSSEGPVTAIDPETGSIRYTVNGGYQPDAIFSPDGTRLYVAGDELSAHDASTGAEIWRVEYQYRLHWTIDTTAPSTLAISPDGSRLYIASYDQERGTSPDANTIPHFIQTFDTANGENLGETEAIRGGCTVPIHPSPDGERLHSPCDGNYSVYALPSGTLQPPPPDRAVISASAQHDDELYLVTSTGRVQIVDMSDVAIVSEATLPIEGQVSPNLAVLANDGARLYIGVSISSEGWWADQVLVFDTATWQQVAQLSLEEPLSNRNLAIDTAGAVYGASTSFVEGTSLPVSSTLWRMHPETGTVEAVVSLAAQEVAHVLLGYVPIADPESTPSEATTPSNPDLTGEAIGTALAELPPDLRACNVFQSAPQGAPVFGRTLGGDGEITLVKMENGEPASQMGIKVDEPTVVRILAGSNPYPEDAQITIRATHAASNSAFQIYPDHPLKLVDVPEYERRIWETELTFSNLGCWELLFISDQFAGVLWIYVQEELPDAVITVYPTASPDPSGDPNATEPIDPTADATPTAVPTPTSTATSLPAPTIDTSAAAIVAALAALPAESKGCQVTPGLDGDAFGWEVRGVTLIGDGELWMSFVGNGTDYLIPPLQAGHSTSVYWNIGGSEPDNPAFVELIATELGTGTRIGPDGPQNAGESPFFEGVMWKSYFTFPHAGCWQVVAERAGYAGVLWLTVEDAP